MEDKIDRLEEEKRILDYEDWCLEVKEDFNDFIDDLITFDLFFLALEIAIFLLIFAVLSMENMGLEDYFHLFRHNVRLVIIDLHM